MLWRNLVSLATVPLLMVAVATTSSTAAPAAAPGGLGLVDPETGRWHLRTASGTVHAFLYGNPGDHPFLGDWDCDGVATPGLYRRSDGYVYLRNSNTTGIADLSYYFGDPGDVPIAGDFDGNGCDTVSLFRPAEARVYVINHLGAGDRGLGAAEAEYPLGQSGDLPFAGDFDGDGVDTFGALRPATGTVLLHDRPGSPPSHAFSFGDPGDLPVAGRWASDTDTVAVYRPGAGFYLRHHHGPGAADELVAWAEPGWLPVAGAAAGAALPAPPVARGASPAPEPGPAPEPEPIPPTPPPPPAQVPAPLPADAEPPPPGNTATDATVYVGEDIQAASDANPPGTTITIARGIHRLQQVVPKSGQTFVGQPGATLSGARLLTDFTRQGDAWVVDGQDQQGQVHGECEPGYDGCRHPEDLFIDDVPLRQVTDQAELGPGRWFFDYDADRIHLADDPTGRRVEVSVARYAFAAWGPAMGDSYANHVTIRDLVIEKYASPAQHGAVHAGGAGDGNPGQGLSAGWEVIDCEIRLNHGAGVRTGDAMRITGSFIHRNGHLGISARGTGIEITGNEIAFNNTARFAVGWDSGGVKAAETEGLAVLGNYAHDNRGFGLWTDIDAVDTRYEANTVADNWGAGILHEISYSAQVLDNVVTGNGAGTADWFYGAGILIAHSSGVEVAGNHVAGNADGIAGIQQDRGSGPLGPHLLDDLWVHDNFVALAGDAAHGIGQDVGDPGVFDRNIRFEGNVYAVAEGSAHFGWDDRYVDEEEWRTLGHDSLGP